MKHIIGLVLVALAFFAFASTKAQETETQMQNSKPDGYLAMPDSGDGRPVLVLHAWWGLNDFMKSVCDRLADSGFVAFAPDLYHGKIAKTIAEAESLGKTVDSDPERTKGEIIEALRYLLATAKSEKDDAAAIGFSLGAYFAVDLSVSDPEHITSVVLFYGTGPGDFTKSKASYLGHFAENDKYEPPEYAQSMEAGLKEAGRPVTFYRYPGTGHWFFESDRPDTYNEAAANLAWKRTLEFLKRSSDQKKEK